MCAKCVQGRIQDFHLGGGGGGAKRSCAPTHIMSTKPEVPYSRSPGPAGWRALEAIGFLMLSHAIWALFLSIPIQNGMEKNIVNQILVGPMPVVPSSKSATVVQNSAIEIGRLFCHDTGEFSILKSKMLESFLSMDPNNQNWWGYNINSKWSQMCMICKYVVGMKRLDFIEVYLASANSCVDKVQQCFR